MKNVITLSVNSTIEDLAPLYVAAIEKDVPFSTIPAPMLWGPPGIGKSDSIKQIAEYIQFKANKKVCITDVRLNLFNPIDLRGIPVANEDKTLAIWLKPKIFDMDPSKEVVNILFLDEISAAPQTVQAAAYQITLDRMIGEHKLPDNCIVIAAGNRTTDHSVAYRMPNALANRLRHIEVASDFESWSKWAMQNSVHPFVLGYLAFDNSKLYQEELDVNQVAFPTPRSWMFVSNILKLMCSEEDESVDKHYSKIAGCVGTAVATEFLAYCKTPKSLPIVQDIFDGKKVEYPTTMDAIYTLIQSMISYIKCKVAVDRESITAEQIKNAVEFVKKLPSDYIACFKFELEQIKELKGKYLESLTVDNWPTQHGWM